MRLTASSMADGHEQRHEEIARASAAQALPALEAWRKNIASALSGVRTEEGAEKALASWGAGSATDARVAEEIRQSVLRSAMAGALHVRIVEVPESMRARRQPTAATRGWVEVSPGASVAPFAEPRRVALTDDDPLDVDDSELPEPEMQVTFNLPFEEAVDEFLARGIVTPEQWREMSDAARRRSFTATRLASDALRARAYSALLRALSEGTSYQTFVRQLRSGEESLGIAPSSDGYLQTLFRTNTAQSYAAGRFQQMQQPEVMQARPYVRYAAVIDDRTTSRCRFCDGLTFDRRNDPGWVRFAPPTHFNCRSTLIVLGPRDVNQSQVTHSSRVDARGWPQEGFGGAPSLDLDD